MNAPAVTDVTTTSWECFDVSIEDKVAHIRLNRPDAFNSMNRAFWVELPAIVRAIDEEARARCIVISSTGKHFCAGMDLSVFQGPADGAAGSAPAARPNPQVSAEAAIRHLKHLHETFACLDEARMPVIAAIQGGCVGGGVDMSSACDIRYCSADAFFVIQEINIGMTADAGTFPRLCRLIPEGWVRELAYTGGRLPAVRAREIGLVNEVFDTHEDVVAHALAVAREIAAKAPLAVTGSKVMINYARDHSIADSLDYLAVWQAGMFSRSDMAEAFKAKAEKRLGDFPELVPIRRGL
ncbi:crotonase/enoyl-CoA hydratase family protein [uncultured Phenylobacterium sp.]|uniref:crotonase/enoyl-CoA hydratase family protein n=1 Tax=uncultured Phenylobacterium sp. TaxID=349273 RepID=UPI0025F0072D|nr:crotonase/enoyl-CoA hydratase family protein [uncultured Phenylobacterium sp.]